VSLAVRERNRVNHHLSTTTFGRPMKNSRFSLRSLEGMFAWRRRHSLCPLICKKRGFLPRTGLARKVGSVARHLRPKGGGLQKSGVKILARHEGSQPSLGPRRSLRVRLKTDERRGKIRLRKEGWSGKTRWLQKRRIRGSSNGNKTRRKRSP